jgi:hypothetical protein
MNYTEGCRVQEASGKLGTVIDLCEVDENIWAIIIKWDDGGLSMKESTCKDIAPYEEAV